MNDNQSNNSFGRKVKVPQMANASDYHQRFRERFGFPDEADQIVVKQKEILVFIEEVANAEYARGYEDCADDHPQDWLRKELIEKIEKIETHSSDGYNIKSDLLTYLRGESNFPILSDSSVSKPRPEFPKKTECCKKCSGKGKCCAKYMSCFDSACPCHKSKEEGCGKCSALHANRPEDECPCFCHKAKD